MVYPKHQALPNSPRKKAKKTHTTSKPKASIATAKTAPTDVTGQGGAFDIICEMLGNCNSMIAMNAASIKKIEETSAKNTEMLNVKVGVLLRHIKTLENRLEEIDAQAKDTALDVARLTGTAGTFINTAAILEGRLRSVERRIATIEHVIVRSRKRKLAKSAQK